MKAFFCEKICPVGIEVLLDDHVVVVVVVVAAVCWILDAWCGLDRPILSSHTSISR